MTDRADKLRRLAERVEAGEHDEWSMATQQIAADIAHILADESRYNWAWWRETTLSALEGSVDSARRLMKERCLVEVVIDLSEVDCRVPESGIYLHSREVEAIAENEAHARTALALRVWAEMEEG